MCEAKTNIGVKLVVDQLEINWWTTLISLYAVFNPVGFDEEKTDHLLRFNIIARDLSWSLFAPVYSSYTTIIILAMNHGFLEAITLFLFSRI